MISKISHNILDREQVLKPNRIMNSGLTQRQAEFMFETLYTVFGDILIPEGSLIKGDHNIDIPVIGC